MRVGREDGVEEGGKKTKRRGLTVIETMRVLTSTPYK